MALDATHLYKPAKVFIQTATFLLQDGCLEHQTDLLIWSSALSLLKYSNAFTTTVPGGICGKVSRIASLTAEAFHTIQQLNGFCK